jgi:hypothetical protein
VSGPGRRRAAWLALAMMAILPIAGAALLGAIPGLKGRYRSSDPALAVAYRARETCACLFVDGRSEPACLEWTRASPDVARVTVEAGRRAVSARALLLWSATARYEGPVVGCRLE